MTQNFIKLLFAKQMDRKQFLAHIGAAILIVIGFSGVMKRLLEYSGRSSQGSKGSGSDYGND